jgi:omega-6 fatty acid desaturase (delta-12 desaturase)
VLNAGFLMRIFIIQHDCGHRSFLRSRGACNLLGSIFGVLTMTPYFHWRHEHDKHHATYGDLDQRGQGDIITLTVEEYQAKSKGQKLLYRLFRHPLVLFGVGPTLSFVIRQRIPYNVKWQDQREWWSVVLTDLAIIAVIIAMGEWIGYKEFVLVQLPITAIGSSLGVWLFYVQHQFENIYWRRHADWDYATAALKGASYYKLPAVLQWFSGNIGLHHVHHMRPRIPNYKLQKAHAENPIFHDATTLDIRKSLKSAALRLWDEQGGKMVGFGELQKK